jgi:ABC-2 type transport system ATP-binding protein
LEEADALANEIVVLNKGRIAACGTAFEIKSRAAARRIRCTTAWPVSEIESLAGVTAVRAEPGCVEIMAANPEDVVRVLLNGDPSLSNLEISGAALEDAFLALTEAPNQPVEVVA